MSLIKGVGSHFLTNSSDMGPRYTECNAEFGVRNGNPEKQNVRKQRAAKPKPWQLEQPKFRKNGKAEQQKEESSTNCQDDNAE